MGTQFHVKVKFLSVAKRDPCSQCNSSMRIPMIVNLPRPRYRLVQPWTASPGLVLPNVTTNRQRRQRLRTYPGNAGPRPILEQNRPPRPTRPTRPMVEPQLPLTPCTPTVEPQLPLTHVPRGLTGSLTHENTRPLVPLIKTRPLIAIFNTRPLIKTRPLVAILNTRPLIKTRPLVAILNTRPLIDTRPLIAIFNTRPLIKTRPLVAILNTRPLIKTRPLVAILNTRPLIDTRPLVAILDHTAQGGGIRRTPGAILRADVHAPDRHRRHGGSGGPFRDH